MKTKKLLHSVEEGTQAAVDRLSPYVEQALREGGDLADQAYAKLRPGLKEAQIRSARFAADTFEKVQPAIDDALSRVSPAVDATVKKVRPAVDDVLERIPPTVDYARERVQEDVLPALAAQLRHLAAQPLAKEIQAAAAASALAAQLEKASGKKKRSGWRTFGRVLLAGALLGGVFVAVRKLFADPATGWENHVPKNSTYVADPTFDDDDLFEDSVAEPVTEPTVSEPVTTEPATTADAPAEPSASAYGPGSYVGDEPPAGYEIKGNDRSLKYHVPGMAAYERTIAEVWFESEEAAQAAGFTRAQR
ncbi:hypothetical protein ATK74_2146 [Propionicimonas paludicola]|uniref:Uncharacterized protein n=1 Tax=Propionicimonas paludicola TaxID=185243 RepID=A0A2A9CSZ8_9ACTN|nr:hypothetical protein ATK74_2146 [Propionicimonas paludicola]